jgi:hypothetical protein
MGKWESDDASSHSKSVQVQAAQAPRIEVWPGLKSREAAAGVEHFQFRHDTSRDFTAQCVG